MAKIAIVFFSAQGHTKQMAEAVAAGAKTVGAEVTLVEVAGKDITEGRYKSPDDFKACNEADAIIFGTPTYMGNISSQIKAFIDGAGGIWFAQGWKNKIAAGFTHSGSLSGDKLNTLQSLMTVALQHGMIWVGQAEMPAGDRPDQINRLGSFSGAMGRTSQGTADVPSGDITTARLLGGRVAEIAAKLVGK